ncbi:VPLPA-CTERM-specific exosortase XrtD [Rhabdochromatium marinum]|uniref:VPLPA-CTERM-specific exosortase XrtD n=1 Tax=Rhabdochromatium marinum TaxID=48729 RepID=UPI0019084221|nr:VPLPA-CTERM-specific exosortase XrtD [Rhabdochromatium marinum]MBK1647098.1 VPLPA-CTERM-specific exosortase XrtD [Rhabdochromatium marinum]
MNEKRFFVTLAVALGIPFLLIGILYWPGIADLLRDWNSREEYSHGYFIPLVGLLLVWQKWPTLAQMRFSGAWFGLGLVIAALLLLLIGQLSTIFLVVHVSLILLLTGLVWAFAGFGAMRIIWVPLIYLVFMIPFPPFLHNQLSLSLQLLSSEIGVWFIRLFGISVFLEGNVIDLGSYQLQVVDACSGLRYLFPLMSFGFLIAYFFKAPWWQRLIVFVSTVPITVAMNSFRIGVTGLLVEYFGIGAAEGFLHDFEGWIIFMACTALLLAEVWLFVRFSRLFQGDRSFSAALALDWPDPLPADFVRPERSVPKPFWAAVALLALTAITMPFLQARPVEPLERESLTVFPEEVGPWEGTPEILQDNILKSLDLTDYFIGDFIGGGDRRVNFYAAFYDSQGAGESAHSPRSCIPGGGWKIEDLQRITLDGLFVAGQPLRVNRLKIQRGDDKQLVYYWFQQRGRVLTNEYAVKWFLFWDALIRNRTDGALVRLTTAIQPWEDWSDGDRRLRGFAALAVPELGRFIPD